jgi:hypothetical protein
MKSEQGRLCLRVLKMSRYLVMNQMGGWDCNSIYSDDFSLVIPSYRHNLTHSLDLLHL